MAKREKQPATDENMSLIDYAREEDETEEAAQPEEATQNDEEIEEEEGGEEEETGEDGDQEESCQSEECQTALINFIKENFGEDLSHYKNDLEAIKGLLNARKAIGKRDLDAKVLSMIRQRYGDEFLEMLVSGQATAAIQQAQQQQAQSNEQNEQDEIEWDDRWLAMVTRDDEGNLVPARGAPPDIVDKVLRFVRHRENVVNEFARNPRRFIENIITEKLSKSIDQLISRKIEQSVTTAAEQVALSEWAQENRHLLFEGGDPTAPMTPLGMEITELADQLMEDGVKSHTKALQRAWEIVMSRQQVQPKKAKVPRLASMHTPQKTQKTKKVTLEDLIDQGYSLVEAYKKMRELSE